MRNVEIHDANDPDSLNQIKNLRRADLNKRLFEIAQTMHRDGDGPAIIRNTTGYTHDVHIAVPGDHFPSHGLNCGPVRLHNDPIRFVHALTQSAHHAPLFDTIHDGEICTYGTGLLVDECDWKALDYVQRRANLQRHDVEFTGYNFSDGAYIDGMSSHGGMIFRSGDFQTFDGFVVSRPMAKDYPERYLYEVATSTRIRECRFVDPSNHGWKKLGDYQNGMYRSSRGDNPDKIRDAVEERGFRVVFVTDGNYNPFETNMTAYVKPDTDVTR